jgi:hypothetical protein
MLVFSKLRQDLQEFFEMVSIGLGIDILAEG